MNLELLNPSITSPLRVFTQVRLSTTAAASTAPAPKKRATRAELEKLGAEIVMVPTRGTARLDGAIQSVTRDVPTEFFKSCGYETLISFVTETMEKELRESQQAAASVAPRGIQFLDEWGAPQPFTAIAPAASATLQLNDAMRYLVECDAEVALTLSNLSNNKTIKLRSRDAKSGATTNVAIIQPCPEYHPASRFVSGIQSATVTANAKSAAVIELMPS